MKKVVVDEEVHLCLFALRNIGPGEEIRYDYGPDTGGTMHWRKVSVVLRFTLQCLR